MLKKNGDPAYIHLGCRQLFVLNTWHTHFLKELTNLFFFVFAGYYHNTSNNVDQHNLPINYENYFNTNNKNILLKLNPIFVCGLSRLRDEITRNTCQCPSLTDPNRICLIKNSHGYLSLTMHIKMNTVRQSERVVAQSYRLWKWYFAAPVLWDLAPEQHGWVQLWYYLYHNIINTKI